MVSEVFVHIGPWKTATTSIQEFLGSIRSELEKIGWYYPIGLAAPNAQHEIPNFMYGSIERMGEPSISYFATRTLSQAMKEIFKKANEAGCDKLLLSAEDYCHLTNEQFVGLVNEFKENGALSITFSISPFDPEERRTAFINQVIRSGEFLQEKDRVELYLDVVAKAGRVYEIVEFLGKLPNVHVNLVPFEKLPGNSFLGSWLMQLFTREQILDWFQRFPPRRENVSLSDKQMEMLNEFNRENNEGREANLSCPIVFSDQYPLQRKRLDMFIAALQHRPD